MARDGEQQAMTSERLAHWHWVMAKHSEPQSMSSVVIDVRDLAAFVAEVERQRAALAAKEAREAALVAVARAVAEANLICQNYFDDGMPFAPPHVDYLCPRHPVKASPLRAQARALLASADEQGEA